jgi:hypothetical protein
VPEIVFCPPLHGSISLNPRWYPGYYTGYTSGDLLVAPFEPFGGSGQSTSVRVSRERRGVSVTLYFRVKKCLTDVGRGVLIGVRGALDEMDATPNK